MITPSPSRAVPVVDRLVELYRQARDVNGPLAGLQVLDGPVLDQLQVDDETFLIAPADGQDGPGFIATRVRKPGLGRVGYVEVVEVALTIIVFGGSVDMPTRRTRADQLLAGVTAVIDDHQVEDDIWDQLELGEEFTWVPRQTSDGSSLMVVFSVIATTHI